MEVVFHFRVPSEHVCFSFCFFSDYSWLEISPGALSFIYFGCCLIRDIQYTVHMKSVEMCTGSKQKRGNLRNYTLVIGPLMVFQDRRNILECFHLTINVI
jgi:hypothetical protein